MPLMARLICLFIQRCIDSEIAGGIGETRIASAWTLHWWFTHLSASWLERLLRM